MSSSRTHYEVLGVDARDASTEDIKRAYKAAVRPAPASLSTRVRRVDRRGIDGESLSSFSSSSRRTIPLALPAQALASHPDKRASRVDGAAGDNSEFLKVQAAWEILKESASRAAYDARLLETARGDADVVVSDEFDVDDMDAEGSSPTKFTRRCRCGDAYEVWSDELLASFDAIDVPCASCSLHARVRLTGGAAAAKFDAFATATAAATAAAAAAGTKDDAAS